MPVLIIKRMRARYDAHCPACGAPIRIGDRMGYGVDLTGHFRCWTCAENHR